MKRYDIVYHGRKLNGGDSFASREIAEKERQMFIDNYNFYSKFCSDCDELTIEDIEIVEVNKGEEK